MTQAMSPGKLNYTATVLAGGRSNHVFYRVNANEGGGLSLISKNIVRPAFHDGQSLAGSGALVFEGEILEFPRPRF